MPNHVTHRVVVTGPEKDLKKFRKEFIVRRPEKDGRREADEFLDFNLVIPMPKSLENTTSPPRPSWKAWYGTEKEVRELLSIGYLSKQNLKDRKDLQEFLLKEDSNAKEEADRTQKNVEKYGYTDWYEWHIAKWGTKWNSYAFRWVERGSDRLEFLFETAWSPPVQIFQELTEIFPKLTFDVKSFDEGWNFGAEGEFKGGFESYEEKEATDELYEAVYGHKPEKEEE